MCKEGEKWVSGGLPMYGIWENGHARVTISPDDERVITPMPRGIVQQGAVEVKAKEDLDGGQDEQGNTGAGTHKPGGMPKVRH